MSEAKTKGGRPGGATGMRSRPSAESISMGAGRDKGRWSRLPGLVLASVAFFGILAGCDYGRMKEQESVRTYETQLPEMPSGTIPMEGGVERLLAASPRDLMDPLDGDPRWIERGKEAYGFYCAMCHGPKADGRGTVGQSFYPLPSNLASKDVQELSDGEIFAVMTFGSKRSPPLGYTIAEEERWAIVRFVRSLGDRAQ